MSQLKKLLKCQWMVAEKHVDFCFLTHLTASNVGSLLAPRSVYVGVSSYLNCVRDDVKGTVWKQYSAMYKRMRTYNCASLFLIAFPLALLMAFVGCVGEARIDGYKLGKLAQVILDRGRTRQTLLSRFYQFSQFS